MVEMRYLPYGMLVANFSLAVSRRWTGKDGQTQEKPFDWQQFMETGRKLR